MSAKPVARLGDTHVCPLHSVNAIVSGSETVIVNNLPMARVGDTTACGATIITGVETVIGERMLVAYLGSETSHGGTIITGSTDTFVDDGTSSGGAGVGGATASAAYAGMEDLPIESIPILPIEATAEMVAEFIESIKEEGISLSIVGSVLIDTAMRKVDKILPIDKIKKEAQELGEFVMKKWKKRGKQRTHPSYNDRTHGPDDLVLDEKNKLSEVEVKGTTDGKAYPAKNTAGEKQGSAKKNKRRAQGMVKNKSKRIGKSSKRKGGPYTQEEINLWEDIMNKDGNKRHIFIHADKASNKAKVYEQDQHGNLGKIIDEFDIDD